MRKQQMKRQIIKTLEMFEQAAEEALRNEFKFGDSRIQRFKTAFKKAAYDIAAGRSQGEEKANESQTIQQANPTDRTSSSALQSLSSRGQESKKAT